MLRAAWPRRELVKFCCFAASTCTQVCSVLDDVYCANDLSSSQHRLTRCYDVVLDKGTYDAICMNPDDTQDLRRKYRQAVSHLVRCGGLFIITSCNWTQDELLQQFDTGNKIMMMFDSLLLMCRDQLNSRFHGHDIFREIGLLP